MASLIYNATPTTHPSLFCLQSLYPGMTVFHRFSRLFHNHRCTTEKLNWKGANKAKRGGSKEFVTGGMNVHEEVCQEIQSMMYESPRLWRGLWVRTRALNWPGSKRVTNVDARYIIYMVQPASSWQKSACHICNQWSFQDIFTYIPSLQMGTKENAGAASIIGYVFNWQLSTGNERSVEQVKPFKEAPWRHSSCQVQWDQEGHHAKLTAPGETKLFHTKQQHTLTLLTSGRRPHRISSGSFSALQVQILRRFELPDNFTGF